jgi:hypothetical protein
MKKHTRLIAVVLILFFLAAIFFVKCGGADPLPDFTFLKTPVADPNIVGKLKSGESFIGSPCSSVDSMKSWNTIENTRGFGDSGSISSKIERALEASIYFSNASSKSVKIDSVVVYQARDYSECPLPSKGSVVVSAAIAVTKFTVNTSSNSDAAITANDLRRKFGNLSVSAHNNIVDVRTANGLVVAVKCIEIVEMSQSEQEVEWKDGQAKALDSFYKKENHFVFRSIDKGDSALLVDSLQPKVYLKMTVSSGEFNESGGTSKTGSILYSAAQKDIDSTSTSLKRIYQDSKYDCKLPTRIFGATGANEIAIYEVTIENAFIKLGSFNPVFPPTVIHGNNWIGYYEVENSSGKFLLRTKRWRYKID